MKGTTLSKRLLLLPVSALCFCSLAVSQQQDTLTELSASIRSKLSELKQQSVTLQNELTDTTARLQQLSEDLRLSEQERQYSEASLTKLSTSLTSMTEQYETLYLSLEKYKVRLSLANRAIIGFAVIVGLRLIGMVAGYILYARGVKLPRWLDILL